MYRRCKMNKLVLPSHAPYVVQSCTTCQMACKRQKVDPFYTEKRCSALKGHSSTPANLN